MSRTLRLSSINTSFNWSTSITASCTGNGRIARSQIQIYSQLREGHVYRRDIGIDLPPAFLHCQGLRLTPNAN